ncbi:MAG: polysaccharide biosynthesis tyrosine autokinase [Lyngbya sp. HA4199-MV5]|jgi:capsular exopolysaccharide synthesis family protein|nr:polysaccharide biosynthesis tyrosine autokinase [Lyngbya sp. HA4199-MV5]
MKPNHTSALSTNGSKPSAAFATQSLETDEATFDLNQPLSIVRRRLGIVLGVAIAVATVSIPLSIWAANRKPPQYAGSFQLLVEPVTAEEQFKRLLLNPEQSPGESLQTAPTALDYPTQIQVLQSPKLLEPIVKEAQTKFPGMTYDRVANSITIGRLLPKNAKKGAEGTKILQVSYQDNDPAVAEYMLKLLSTAYLNYSRDERQTNIGQGVKFINEQLPKLRQRVNTLQQQLQDFRQRYVIVNPDTQGQQAVGQSGNLEQQQMDTATKLAESRSRLSALSRNVNNADVASALAEAPQYQALLGKYQEVTSQIALETARSRETNPTLQALRDRQANLKRLLEQESQRVLGKVNDELALLQARDQAISRSKGEVDARIRQYPALARQFTDIERELTVATNSLNEFLAKQEALQIDAAQKEVPWELLSPPTLARDATGEPLNVASSALLNYIGVSIFLSLFLGIIAGFLADTSSNAYHTAKDIRQATRLPLLGVIPLDPDRATPQAAWYTKLPLLKRKRHQPTHETAPVLADPSTLELPEIRAMFSANRQTASSVAATPFVEAFRSLYKNICLQRPDTSVRSLTISSPEPGDGKTTIAVNLALAAAAMGQRVLLVDADLRHPQVHHQMGLPNQLGLSDIMTTNTNVRAALQQSPIRDNLMVLTAGQTAVDPTETLTSGKMRLLMERFRMVFDLVIYDTPPLVGLADSSLVASQTDGLTLVVRLGKTKRPTLNQALEELKISSTMVLGMVANGGQEALVPYAYHYQAREASQNGAAPVEV